MEPLIRGRHTYASISDQISDAVLARHFHRRWYIAFGIACLFAFAFLYATAYLFAVGVGIWGVNIPVAWGFAITNFVWWIGIGHAGTFISAILLLLRQGWRTSINRFAEAMTLFAAGIAGIFPILHLGRPWFFYWLLPYPDKMGLWPQWRSPLVWDIFAISTYLLVSLLFWYLGMVPDLATLRDRASGRLRRTLYGLFALGWRGEARHWARLEMAYLLLAGLATPLVVSVHSVVSLDFAIGIVPGWHDTIFPPYFVAGALYSGFAMVLTLAIPLRWTFGLQAYITERHLDHAAKVMLATGLLVAYGYCCELFNAWYGGDIFDRHHAASLVYGNYAPLFWTVVGCNVVVGQTLWFRRIRTSPLLLFLVAVVINIGMWLERFMIIVASLAEDFLPTAWYQFRPSVWDLTHLFGSIGLFAALFFLFVRFLPAISIYEMRELVHEKPEAHR